jgi:NAD(P)-dependent dehydrogenase (short-subunit alcohol dehydrogenase family)
MVPFNVDLNDKVAVVTGGGGVLCSEMARALGECGAKVAVLSRRIEPIEAVAEQIRAAGGTAMAVSCDVTNAESLAAANDTITAEFGPCDILINGAGGNHPGGTAAITHLTTELLAESGPDNRSFFDLDPDALDFVFKVNFNGTLMATQAFSRSMAERGGGTVINISSMTAFTPLTKVAAYSAAKAAVNSFTEWLAVHLAGTGVRVNAIAPGFFLTEQNRTLLTNEDGSFTARAQTIINNTPAGRFGKPEELTGALLWLVSEEASGFVTGVVVPVDGGFNAFSGV